MYYELGAAESQWCSTTNPQGSCKPTSGVCKPMDAAALAIFKDLQNQLNRVAVKSGLSRIDVDGRIGSSTVSLYNKVAGGTFTSCDALAEKALTANLAGQVRAVADRLGAPATVPAPWTSRPSTVAKDGGIKDPPALAITDSIFGLVSSPFGLLIAAGLGYGAYRIAKGGKKGAVAAPKKRLASHKPARARRPPAKRRRR